MTTLTVLVLIFIVKRICIFDWIRGWFISIWFLTLSSPYIVSIVSYFATVTTEVESFRKKPLNFPQFFREMSFLWKETEVFISVASVSVNFLEKTAGCAVCLKPRLILAKCLVFQGRSMCPALGLALHPRTGATFTTTCHHRAIYRPESTNTGVVPTYRKEWLKGRIHWGSSRAVSRPCRRNVCTYRRRRSPNGSTRFCWRYYYFFFFSKIIYFKL